MNMRKYIKILVCVIVLTTAFSIFTVNGHAVSYDDNNIMYSDKANDLLCTLSKRNYYKAYDGWAIVAYYYCSTGYSGPILVSDEADNVAFRTTWDSRILKYGGTVVYNEKTYYYSSTEYFMPGNLTNTDANKLYKCNNGNKISVQNAALELLKKYLICDGKYREHQDVREIVQQEATCTTPGQMIKKCVTCNAILETVEIPSTDHMYGAFVVDREASCNEDGTRHQTCLICGYNYSETIAKHDHSFGDWKVVNEATCNAEGKKERQCSECKKTESDTLPILEHSYSEYSVVSGSKLIPPIVKERKCILCGEIDHIRDWSYVWITFLAAIAVIGIVIGLISYIRAFKKK